MTPVGLRMNRLRDGQARKASGSNFVCSRQVQRLPRHLVHLEAPSTVASMRPPSSRRVIILYLQWSSSRSLGSVKVKVLLFLPSRQPFTSSPCSSLLIRRRLDYDLTRFDSLSDTSLSDMSAKEVCVSRPCSDQAKVKSSIIESAISIIS